MVVRTRCERADAGYCVGGVCDVGMGGSWISWLAIAWAAMDLPFTFNLTGFLFYIPDHHGRSDCRADAERTCRPGASDGHGDHRAWRGRERQQACPSHREASWEEQDLRALEVLK